MAARNLRQVVTTEYPKFVDHEGAKVLVHSEDELVMLENKVEIERMRSELEAIGKKVDMRSHSGPNGFGSLKAYYEAVMAREPNGPGG